MNDKEFLDFMQFDQNPSPAIDQKIIQIIEEKLKRFKRLILIKAWAIHWISGAITLSFCPQFGWNPFGASPHLPHIFMDYGMWACGLFCGALFVGVGGLMTLLVLQKSEKFYYQKKGFSIATVISAISLGLLMLLGATTNSLDIYFSFVFITFWVIGALAIEALVLGAFVLDVKMN